MAKPFYSQNRRVDELLRTTNVPHTEPAVATDSSLSIRNLVTRDPRAGLAEDVRRGLSSEPKRFLPKYFYDELGSQLFEAICLLPEYYLTRAEDEIFATHAPSIADAAAEGAGEVALLEL